MAGAVGALSNARNPNTYLGVRHRRLAGRIGKSKAIVATQHAILATVWAMAATGALYDEPGPDYYTRRRPDHAKHRAIRQLQSLGYNVVLERPPD